MKLAPSLALALLAACAGSRAAGPAAAAGPPDGPSGAPSPAAPVASEALASLSRAITLIDDAARLGTIAAERARWAAALAAAPGDLQARFLALYAQPHGEEGWAAFRALSREPGGAALGELGMARIYVEWRVLDQVPGALARARAADPGSGLVALVQALADERAGRLEAAAAGYRGVVAADPGNVEAHVGLARLAQAGGDGAAARAEAQAALAGLPEHAPALLILAAEVAGDAATAEPLLARAVAASPRDRSARVALARLLSARGEAAGARDQWRAAVALREDVEGLLALAGAARQAGDRAGEQRALERLSQLDPSGAEWRRIAEIRLAAGDLEGAEQALRRALARDPGDAGTSLALGRVALRLDRPQEALERLRAGGPEGAAEREALERRLNVERPLRGDVAAIQRAVGALLDRTYRGRLQEAPRLSGRLTVRATVDGTGAATLVEVLEDSVHDEDVRACAYWNLRDATYPANKPGRYAFAFALRPAR